MTWEVGDVALCTWKHQCADGLEVNRPYTVVEVSESHPFSGEPGKTTLRLAELGDLYWYADRFRRIKPDRKAGEDECPMLLNLIKTPVKETEDA
jgi:hypothetical protein